MSGALDAKTPAWSRRMAAYWLAAWAAVATVWIADVVFQFMRMGTPVADLAPAVTNSLATIVPGALLSLVVWEVFHRADIARRLLRAKIGTYLLLGAAFWLVWSLTVAGLATVGAFRGPDVTTDFASALFHQLAGLGFNGSLVFTALLTAYEARHHARTARYAEVRASELRTGLARAQMTALNAQLSPHFLFNTLHVASGLMSRDVPAARRVLADLAGLLRGSFDAERHGLIALGDDLRLAERYLEIQRARFGDRLSVDLDIDPDTLGLAVPPFLVQPLVENAVVHGVSRSARRGWVRIEAARQGDDLCLAVTDSGGGAGARPDHPPRERIGLGGTRRRLALHFGDEATLRFSPREGGGSCVRVTLPVVPIDGAPPARESAADISPAAGPADHSHEIGATAGRSAP